MLATSEAGNTEFHLSLFAAPVFGTFPELTFFSATGSELPDFQQLLLLYYFATADGTPVTGKWVSFADLPSGRMYAQAFQGYSGDEIVKAFGEGLASFTDACQKAGGQLADAGDAAFIFQALPQVSVMMTYWLGDEDFPSSCKILFDANATHYLPIDGCAIIGSTLVKKILKLKV
ncbi:MAG: DUF3786 domain-containing protein [Chloroflexi bacterium]|nr:DUF3786 domain-containing protein [Chloroflexota bacterium]